ncbi:hypothetical protein [Bordetella sp. N]|uniref:hypothetical protein n=1 Tax=Bordetella sp. N TaxID=1746199 RepID=UPI00070CB6D8|nr:hypothetical protein [Bordetella sp. N]ALM86697.1 hypothetical protein ASB57_03015 [Bordetella sp. N]
MEITSTRRQNITSGVALHTTLDGEVIRAYAVVSAPDLNAIAQIVPPEEVEAGGEIHATAVTDADSAESQVFDVLDNINPNDIAVFLCANEAAYLAALALLGLRDDQDTGLH